MKACLIYNAAAGSAADDVFDRVHAILAPRFELNVLRTSPDRDPSACAREALDAGAELLIAAGGDGTVSSVAGVLAGSKVPLGILPCGTSNSLAAALGIPGDPIAACDTLLADHRRVIDTALVDHRCMVLHASVGLHADTVADTSTEDKHRWGVLAYVATAVRKLSTLAPFEVELETDEQIVRCRAVAVTVANMAPLRTVLAQGPSALVGDDGMLDVTVVAATTLNAAVATGIHLFLTAARGEPATRDEVGYFPCRRLRILADPAQHLLIDGEAAGTTPVAIECRPASLVVLAPPSAEPAKVGPEIKLPTSPEAKVEIEASEA
ncbi:YegS/Rv2252/BmrU family lipid kinase [Polyangium sorediatum]|uniref:YegS/Rv2252/BmrU family lipid kinase n=1 Tax=Polyangium sorediatum TaxID=889274 RepID=A0ABT6P392_9BACT|nr:YegS/Rv2252/BmrU family lipid kinase [Polyangium sorediatum]MDI1434822.1 YegS/Rv2252/BmrU family lipid kinase [Polyangium sorediatum]